MRLMVIKMKKNNGSCLLHRSIGGFTLIELLIVVAIIGLLVAISVPVLMGQRKSAARSEAVNNLTTLRLILEQTAVDRGGYCCAGPDGITGTGDDVCADTGTVAAGTAIGMVGGNAVARLQTLQGWWPKFQPGSANDLNYEYAVQCPAIPSTNRVHSDGTVSTVTTTAPFNNGRSFTAFARPKAGTIVAPRGAAPPGSGDIWINDRNENNFK